MKMKKLLTVLGFAVTITFSAQAYAETAIIAVAANFTKTIEKVGAAFEAANPEHSIKFSFGPTGKLYAQIQNGAPFDAFFSADDKAPQKVVDAGLAVAESYDIYAQGKIVLYSRTLPVADIPLETLKEKKFKYIALANPKTAPYGERAQAYLQKMGLFDGLKTKIVNGESISQAFQYVATGNAEIGFIALSQVVDAQSPVYQRGEYWVVPQADYEPINQASVVLKKGENNAAIKGFMAFLKTPEAIKIIESYGYGVK